MKNKKQIKEDLILAGVRNLKEFGYPSVNAENILTDKVYSRLFKSMLNDNKGHLGSIDNYIDELISDIDSIVVNEVDN